MATIHAEISNEMDIVTAHDIVDRIEREIGRELGILLVIHMDPIEIHDKEVLSMKEKLSRLIHALDARLSFHDFHVLKEPDMYTLVFDLVVPDSYSEADADQVLHQLMTLIHEMAEHKECIITLDRNFAAPM